LKSFIVQQSNTFIAKVAVRLRRYNPKFRFKIDGFQLSLKRCDVLKKDRETMFEAKEVAIELTS